MLVVGMTISVIPAFATVDDTEIIPFIFGTGSSPSSFDPLGAYDTTSGDIINNVYEGLFAINYATDAVEPGLASGMGTWNAAGTEWTIPLRSDVIWHNNVSMNATHIKWNFDRLENLSVSGLNEHASLWFNDDGDFMLESTEVTGIHEIKFTLVKAWFDFEKLLPFWGISLIFPDSYYAEDICPLTEMGYLYGTGPFELSTYTIDEKTVLLRSLFLQRTATTACPCTRNGSSDGLLGA